MAAAQRAAQQAAAKAARYQQEAAAAARRVGAYAADALGLSPGPEPCIFLPLLLGVVKEL